MDNYYLFIDYLVEQKVEIYLTMDTLYVIDDKLVIETALEDIIDVDIDIIQALVKNSMEVKKLYRTFYIKHILNI